MIQMGIIRRIREAMARAMSPTVRSRKGARVQCESCRQWVDLAYLTPGAMGGIELRCDGCRAAWHQGIRDLYAHRAAEQAAARYDGERIGTILPASPAPSGPEEP
ncbi:MAG: hypothetical protein HYY11_03025 [Candidatus Methylomirabilis oxyfera]|nr:hypothetical protein [Candidatus Methylomirabilis oxyfera]